jgi:hypothetical protein
MILDRRERWRRSQTVHGEYNTLRLNSRREANTKNMQQLAQLLFTAMGEPGADVSVLPTNVYPPVYWDHVPALDAARELLEPLGYSVTLGYGNESVKVVRLGASTQAIPTTDKFVGTDALDPKESPRYIRNVFEPTIMQARFLLQAVGVEDDGTWAPIEELSYTPTGGWGTVAPETAIDQDQVLTEAQERAARGYIRRVYQVKGFIEVGQNWAARTSSWELPDGTGELSGLQDVLPLQNRLLEAWEVRPGMSYVPFRIYGRRTASDPDRLAVFDLEAAETTQPYELLPERSAWLDGENGLVIFDNPIYLFEGGLYKPAELVLECTFTITDQTTYAKRQHYHDVEIDPVGTGYVVQKYKQAKQVTILYVPLSHQFLLAQDNGGVINAEAEQVSLTLAGRYPTAAAQQVVYSQPQLNLRNDGAVLQVQHVLTNGEDHQVNRTILSKNFEFDRGAPPRSRRLTAAYARTAREGASSRQLDRQAEAAAND